MKACEFPPFALLNQNKNTVKDEGLAFMSQCSVISEGDGGKKGSKLKIIEIHKPKKTQLLSWTFLDFFFLFGFVWIFQCSKLLISGEPSLIFRKWNSCWISSRLLIATVLGDLEGSTMVALSWRLEPQKWPPRVCLDLPSRDDRLLETLKEKKERKIKKSCLDFFKVCFLFLFW